MWAEHPLFTIIGGACLVAGLALIVHMIINRLFRKKKIKHTKTDKLHIIKLRNLSVLYLFYNNLR